MKKPTINFQPEFKLWLACSAPGSFRQCLEYVFFKNGYAYASNSQILAKLPLELLTTFEEGQRELLNGFAIHGSLLKFIVGFENVTVEKVLVRENGMDKFAVQLVARKGDNNVIIQLADTLTVTPPDFDAVLNNDVERKPISDIGFRTKYLADLTSALGAESVKMSFTTDGNKVYVQPSFDATGGYDVIGLIMPIIVEQTIPGFDE